MYSPCRPTSKRIIHRIESAVHCTRGFPRDFRHDFKQNIVKNCFTETDPSVVYAGRCSRLFFYFFTVLSTEQTADLAKFQYTGTSRVVCVTIPISISKRLVQAAIISLLFLVESTAVFAAGFFFFLLAIAICRKVNVRHWMRLYNVCSDVCVVNNSKFIIL